MILIIWITPNWGAIHWGRLFVYQPDVLRFENDLIDFRLVKAIRAYCRRMDARFYYWLAWCEPIWWAKRSNTHVLFDMVHTWLLAAEERKASHVVLLDYWKAFNHVDHTVLVNKCKSYDLPNFIIRWLCALLSNKCQKVRLGKELSDWVMLKGSISQGSWLGPLLLIVLINDLHSRVPCTNTWIILPSPIQSTRGVQALCNHT